ncbi:uncharacterized protein [Callorhinus ursinus]|uniref:Uncharacterized protein LOC112816804 isoform X2 n=1 Tax=Callorhinus ursinus TaxID=34884 RepID=A0A3Q7NEZ0_CALUR|nr:uncharacterized protein LOC112816804 isoform X2 [Callorhinus ursinus]
MEFNIVLTVLNASGKASLPFGDAVSPLQPGLRPGKELLRLTTEQRTMPYFMLPRQLYGCHLTPSLKQAEEEPVLQTRPLRSLSPTGSDPGEGWISAQLCCTGLSVPCKTAHPRLGNARFQGLTAGTIRKTGKPMTKDGSACQGQDWPERTKFPASAAPHLASPSRWPWAQSRLTSGGAAELGSVPCQASGGSVHSAPHPALLVRVRVSVWNLFRAVGRRLGEQGLSP